MTIPPLRVRSPYSLLSGMVRYEQMADFCCAHNIPAIAVTDKANLFGALDFSMSLTKRGIQPLLGVELPVQSKEVLSETRGLSAPPPCLQLIAQNQAGYANLLALINLLHRREGERDEAWVLESEVFEHNQGVLCLSGGFDGPVCRELLAQRDDVARHWLTRWRDVFDDRLYVGLCRQRLDPTEIRAALGKQADVSLPDSLERHADQVMMAVMDLADRQSLPMVVLNASFYTHAGQTYAYQALCSIGLGQLLTEYADHALDRFLPTPEQLQLLYADVPEVLSNTADLVKRCTFVLQPVDQPLLPQDLNPEKGSDVEQLRQQSRAGLRRHLQDLDWEAVRSVIGLADVNEQTYHDRLDFELNVIEDVGFAAYFLIVSEFVGWARNNDIPVGPGRGSGGASIVAWSLGITSIDPIRYRLVFERFLNPERVSLPDFDIDFCVEGRDRVVEYVRERYGDDNVAQIVTFGSLGSRSALRDVGRVLGMSYTKVDRISKRLTASAGYFFSIRQLKEENDPLLAEIVAEDEQSGELIRVASELDGLYRHISTHAGGVIISNVRLDQRVPIVVERRSGHRLVGFNMKMTEAAGLVKFDFLGLKTLTTIQRTLELIGQTHPEVDLTMDTIPLDRPEAFEGLKEGDTFAIFQMESDGMRDTVVGVKPECIEDIVALLSLYRPGPMQHIPSYIARRHGREPVSYPHPLLEPILRDTLGIVVYQEQVLQIAQHVAGFSLGRADLLRRAIGKKIRSELERLRAEFIEGSQQTSNLTYQQAENLYGIIEQFADYGFNRAHATGYALIVYLTAWLKAIYPTEFLAASMSMDAQRHDRLTTYVRELERLNIQLLGPDINESQTDFAPVVGGSRQMIRYGLAGLRNVSRSGIKVLVEDREKRGAFASLSDFIQRIPQANMGVRSLESLIRSGALDGLAARERGSLAFSDSSEAAVGQGSEHRAQMIQQARIWISHAQRLDSEHRTGQTSLFGEEQAHVDVPAALPRVDAPPSWDSFRRLKEEYDAFGFYFSEHPLQNFRFLLEACGVNVGPIDTNPEERKEVLLSGLLTKRRSRRVPRGRVHILSIEGLSGPFEAVFFDGGGSDDQDMRRKVELLETQMEDGWAPVCVAVEASRQEEHLRLRIQKLWSLFAYFQESFDYLVLHLRSEAQMHQFQELQQCLDTLTMESLKDQSFDLGPMLNDDQVPIAGIELQLPGSPRLRLKQRLLVIPATLAKLQSCSAIERIVPAQ